MSIKKVHVKTGDEVIIINGKYRGAKGKVLQVAPSEGKVIVDGVNVVTKHVKPKKMGEEGWSCKGPKAHSMLTKFSSFAPKCGRPTRVGHTVKDKNGKKDKKRICKKCKAEF
jgi:large subunit ribosomal protein L24